MHLPEDESDIPCFVSDTRNESPVHGSPGDLDFKRLERESLSLNDTSDSKVDAMSGRPQQMLKKKHVFFHECS